MDRISIDEIDATLEIFEIVPEHQKPHPSFWDEVSDLYTNIEDTIERWSEVRCEVEILETLCQLRVMADALKSQSDKNTIQRDGV